ncbi:hypothetical protein [Faecalimonas sp.]
MKDQKLWKERKKDIYILIGMVICSGILAYFFRDLFSKRFEAPFVWIWCLVMLEPIFVAYSESRDNDEFVTGKTQTLGVVNSFTTATVVLAIMAKWFISWLIISVVVAICMFAARELGRKKRRKLQENYLMKKGVLLTDLHNYGIASINGRSVKVCSKKELQEGTEIVISEVKGKYLYVEEV